MDDKLAMERSPPAQKSRKQRHIVVSIHRWVSLVFAAFWIIQAATGVLIVYHWELADRSISALHRPTDFAALERRIALLAPPGGEYQAKSLWVSAGLPDRYNLTLAGPDDAERAVRLAGDGTELEVRDGGSSDPFDVLVRLHQTLLAGETGEWIVGFSGILLLSNLILGLTAAWPGSNWRRALVPQRQGSPAARTYSWHRALGLWVVVPALLLVGSGVLLRFEHGVGEAIGYEAPKTAPKPPTVLSRQIGVERAVAVARAAIPGSRFTAATWPKSDDATWRLRMLEPGEIRRAYGTSQVHIDAETGAVRAVYPASRAAPPRAFINALYAVHTGELGGSLGRVLVLSIGLWLATMIVLGVLLWQRRRRG